MLQPRLHFTHDPEMSDDPEAPINKALLAYMDKDYETALPILRELAEEGDGQCLNLLGVMSELGEGVEVDEDLARDYYRRAAEKGHPAGTYNLGLRCLLNVRKPDDSETRMEALKDIEKAMEYIKKAADQGLPAARITLGFLALEGLDEAGTEEEGVAYLREAAEQGLTEARTRLGQYHMQNFDFERAMFWLKLSGDDNDPQAIYELAIIHTLGLVGEKNPELGDALLKQAAALDHPEALNQLGLIAASGEDPDFARAKECWERAAALGCDDAEFHLGVMYTLGDYVEKNDDVALEWFLKAANKEHPKAEFNAGLLFFKRGEFDKAMDWWQLASEHGSEEAKEILAKIDDLTDELVNDGEDADEED